VKALTAAARGEHKAPPLNYEEYYAKLGLDPTVEHEPSVVNRAFRTAVAQAPLGRDGKPAGVRHAAFLFRATDSQAAVLFYSSRSYKKLSITSWHTLTIWRRLGCTKSRFTRLLSSR
jgi:hypothetical protein